MSGGCSPVRCERPPLFAPPLFAPCSHGVFAAGQGRAVQALATARACAHKAYVCHANACMYFCICCMYCLVCFVSVLSVDEGGWPSRQPFEDDRPSGCPMETRRYTPQVLGAAFRPDARGAGGDNGNDLCKACGPRGFPRYGTVEACLFALRGGQNGMGLTLPEAETLCGTGLWGLVLSFPIKCRPPWAMQAHRLRLHSLSRGDWPFVSHRRGLAGFDLAPAGWARSYPY